MCIVDVIRLFSYNYSPYFSEDWLIFYNSIKKYIETYINYKKLCWRIEKLLNIIFINNLDIYINNIKNKNYKEINNLNMSIPVIVIIHKSRGIVTLFQQSGVIMIFLKKTILILVCY
jgi:hypothetical protein